MGTLGKNKWGARAWETNYTKKNKLNKTNNNNDNWPYMKCENMKNLNYLPVTS